jgi:hypothetical protein
MMVFLFLGSSHGFFGRIKGSTPRKHIRAAMIKDRLRGCGESRVAERWFSCKGFWISAVNLFFAVMSASYTHSFDGVSLDRSPLSCGLIRDIINHYVFAYKNGHL